MRAHRLRARSAAPGARSVAVLSILVGGCAQLLEFNLYQPLERDLPIPTAADLSALETSSGVGAAIDLIASQLDSPDAVAGLTDDPEARDQLAGYLRTQWDVDVMSQSYQDAQEVAALYAELIVATSGGAPVVNNVFNALLDGNFDFSSAEDGGFNDLIIRGLPDGSATAQDDFVKLIRGFLAAQEAFESFGDNLDPDGDGPLEAAPADVNLGEMAQTAMIASVVDAMADNVTGGADPAQALYALFFLDDSSSFSSTDIGDPLEGGALGNILVASGIDGLIESQT